MSSTPILLTRTSLLWVLGAAEQPERGHLLPTARDHQRPLHCRQTCPGPTLGELWWRGTEVALLLLWILQRHLLLTAIAPQHIVAFPAPHSPPGWCCWSAVLRFC